MSDVKRYDFIGCYGMENNADGDYVRHSDCEADRSALLARIATLEREKEEARDKALEDAAEQIDAYEGDDTCTNCDRRLAHLVREMKGTKP